MHYRIAFLLAAFALTSCDKRTLTQNESAFLGTVHGSNIEYSKVVLHQGGLPDVFPNTGGIAVGYDVYLAERIFRKDLTLAKDDGTPPYIEDLALLAHELTHVWQYNSGKTPSCTVSNIAKEHRNFGSDVYKYTLPLSRTKTFLSYRCEQQGAIVEHWVKKRASGAPDAKLYEAVIREAMPLDKIFASFGQRNSNDRIKK